VTVRPFGPGDSWEHLTDLLHRAYAALAAKGWNYTAVDQSVEVTQRRASRGTCLVAERDGRVVGTIAVQPPNPQSPSAREREPGVALLGQFAVEPSLQRSGIGDALFAEAERVAARMGARTLLGDTAEGASHLVGWYERRGWRVVDTVQWPGKTYRSVVLEKRLG
jgi:predicted N-acetyltransferase YhbS